MTVQEADRDIREQLAEIHAKLDALLAAQESARDRKEWYAIPEAAKLLGRTPYTVREWARLGRIHAAKRGSGHGRHKDWMIGHAELERIRNEGLLPLRPATGP